MTKFGKVAFALAMAFSARAAMAAPAPSDHGLRLFREDSEALRKNCRQEVRRCGECKADSRPAAGKPCGKKDDPALRIMTLRAQGVKVKSFAVKPPTTLGDALAKLRECAPGVPVRVKPLKDGTTPAVPQVRVEDATVYETAMILCEAVDYSVRMTPQGILAEPKD